MMVRYFQFVFFLLVTMFLPGLSEPFAADQLTADMLQKLKLISSDPQQRREAIFAGEERALICGYCHGNDGNSVKPEVPNLAGQNPDYLLQQVSRFARGERKDFVMNSLASKFSTDDQINLAIFYSSQQVKPVQVNQARARQGQKLYMQQCQACHGPQGRGKIGFARLAGQKPTYLTLTLQAFRDSALGKSTPKKRHSPIMEPIARRLADHEIQNLAAYIASM